jgi:hypothetical protein
VRLAVHSSRDPMKSLSPHFSATRYREVVLMTSWDRGLNDY